MSAEHNFPHFEMLEEGFSCIRMEGKSEMSEDSKNIRLTPRKTHGFDWDMVDASNVTTASTASANGVTKSLVEEVTRQVYNLFHDLWNNPLFGFKTIKVYKKCIL